MRLLFYLILLMALATFLSIADFSSDGNSGKYFDQDLLREGE